MATSVASTSHAVGKSDRSRSQVVGSLVCLAVVGVAMASLWLGLTGLMSPDHTGGLLRTLGGFAAFYLIFLLTLVAAVRQK
jgi:hypothetical protein